MIGPGSWSEDRWRNFRRERLPVVVWSIAAVICGAVLGVRAQRFEYYEWEEPALETQTSVDQGGPVGKPEELQE